MTVTGPGQPLYANAPQGSAFAGRLPARFQVRNNQAYLSVTDSPTPVMTTLAPTMIAATGASMAHENRQPNLALRFCIALSGNFPPRS